ncbi:uncharacterized protein CMU_029040 [Cryptosporidium muris RN66]|uniref:BAG domain-containing protein n=1 Tax=Cryptosporidium muris (strain RN66) TaxID=441375 RepID=B6AHY9_CRYMR|nr:uncharacterized protein CMU_029040 [Cryptosporidium muris RN66]EEA07830.1 hypothetical protein, conserved [Cryptosporidium muris RN66]|eukprot:XP_002142179.1 hypothetical protein [Cryptosporidium muris RN66]
MTIQDTASTAGILAELNNRLTSYESTIRELRVKNRDFVNRLRDSQQIRKDLCIKINNLQDEIDKKEKEIKLQRDQNKQLKKRITNLTDLNSNYQSKIEELRSACNKLRTSLKSEYDKEIILEENKLSTSLTNKLTNLTKKKPTKSTDSISENNKLQLEVENTPSIPLSSTLTKFCINQVKPLVASEGDLQFSVEEVKESNSEYIPVSDDPIDRAIATFSNNRKNKVMFSRVKQGIYMYGRLMVEAKLVTKPGIDKNKPLLRIASRGKLYTLTDFVTTHEDEEFANIENTLRKQTGTNESSNLVASPVTNLRTPQQFTSNIVNSSMISPTSSKSAPLNITSTTPFQMQKALKNYDTTTNVPPPYYNNSNSSIPQQSTAGFGVPLQQQSVSSMIPNQHYTYFPTEHQINAYNISYPTTAITDYIPISTPIVLPRQPMISGPIASSPNALPPMIPNTPIIQPNRVIQHPYNVSNTNTTEVDSNVNNINTKSNTTNAINTPALSENINHQYANATSGSISAATIGEWYRQASILSRCNSISTNKESGISKTKN